MSMRTMFRLSAAAAVACMVGYCGLQSARAEEVSLESPWYMSVSVGHIQFEGDEPLKDGYILMGRLGYDLNEWWGVELTGQLSPYLKANRRYRDVVNEEGTAYVVDENGNRVREQRLGPTDIDDTYGAGLAIDGLFHFTRWERLDPFLTLGAGAHWYGDEVNGSSLDGSIRAGGGVMYHFNDEWGVRADVRTFVAGNDTEANMTIDGGVIWNWGARVPPDFVAVGGPKDSDGDGLSDEEEAKWGTDPFDPDTDHDGLSDGDEVYKYKTDPLNPDSDWDGLKDGEEVHKYTTNPLDRDTDDGGVADGHEVIEDHTNPLDPKDDLMLFELYIQFDWDQAVVKPEFFAKLDVIAKVMQRHSGSTARIEGHADRNKKSKADHNKKLSHRRAEAVLSYIAEHGGIARNRMQAVGYGFDRPKAPNNPETGNPENRRVEVYIRGAGQAKSGALVVTPEEVAAP